MGDGNAADDGGIVLADLELASWFDSVRPLSRFEGMALQALALPGDGARPPEAVAGRLSETIAILRDCGVRWGEGEVVETSPQTTLWPETPLALAALSSCLILVNVAASCAEHWITVSGDASFARVQGEIRAARERLGPLWARLDDERHPTTPDVLRQARSVWTVAGVDTFVKVNDSLAAQAEGRPARSAASRFARDDRVVVDAPASRPARFDGVIVDAHATIAAARMIMERCRPEDLWPIPVLGDNDGEVIPLRVRAIWGAHRALQRAWARTGREPGAGRLERELRDRSDCLAGVYERELGVAEREAQGRGLALGSQVQRLPGIEVTPGVVRYLGMGPG